MLTKYEYGTLIAKFMAYKTTTEQDALLEDWILEDENNMKLFEDLINEHKAMWAKQWFKEAGIRTRGIKWKDMDGWYKPETPPERVYYILAVVVFMVMVGVYFLLKWQ